MDKDQFIRSAPDYYFAALAWVFDSEFSMVSEEELKKRAQIRWSSWEVDPLFELAKRKMVEAQLLVVIPDPFGPTLYRRSDTFGVWWLNNATENVIIAKMRATDDPVGWIRNALENLLRVYDNLKLGPADFEDESAVDVWKPIPLDRTQPELVAATAALEEAIEKIGGDNGFAATYPGERSHVISRLKMGLSILKTEAQIYWMQAKGYILEPLQDAIFRLGQNAAGAVASAAKMAMMDFLKKYIGRVFDLMS